MITIFIDNLLITGGSTSEIKAAKSAFQTWFQMSDLGLCKFYLKMTVNQDCEKQIPQLADRAYWEKILLDH